MVIKTHCKRSHELTGENINKAGKCKACERIYQEKHRRKNGQLPRKRTLHLIICKYCNKQFEHSDKRREFCSLNHKMRFIKGYKIINNVEYCKNNHVAINEGKCVKCKSISRSKSASKSRAKAPDKINAINRWCYHANRNTQLLRMKIRVETLPDYVVAGYLQASVKVIPPEILELKRQRLLQKRELRELTKLLKGE